MSIQKDVGPKVPAEGRGVCARKLCINFICGKYKKDHCPYTHATPEGAEGKAHYKKLYTDLTGRSSSRSNSPAPGRNQVRKFFQASNCKYGDKCKTLHHSNAAPAMTEEEKPKNNNSKKKNQRSPSTSSASSSSASTQMSS